MRNIIVLCACTLIFGMISAAQTDGRLVVGDESSHYFAQVENTGTTPAALTALFAGRLRSDPGEGKQFGFIIKGRGKDLLSTPLLEIRESASKKTIRKITLGEYFGKGDAGWKRVEEQSSHIDGSVKDAFTFTASGVKYTFGRTVEVVTDSGAPRGKQIRVSFMLGSNQETSVIVRFLGSANGVVAAAGNSCRVGNAATEKESKAYLMLTLASAGTIAAGPISKNGESQAVTIESEETKLQANRQTEVLAFTFTGTTVGSSEYARQQAENYFSMQKNKNVAPQLVAVTSVNKPSTAAGDTVTYTIVYCNIGTAPAADVAIDNPIPAGTHYLENSATGEGGEVVVNRTADSVKSIGWKFPAPIAPGERKSVHFRVKVL
jgi:uncharacterized repeat protein (TIGR01451 family)